MGSAGSVVTAIPDEQKGERLVAFYTQPGIAPDQLWEKMNDSELPKLWIPKRDNLYWVETVPLLGSGKFDLKKVKAMALERANG